jgi:hypothetical protein
MPSPSAFNDRSDVESLRAEAELANRPVRLRNEHGRITWPSAGFPEWHCCSGHLLDSTYDLTHRVTPPQAQVYRGGRAALQKSSQCQHLRVSEVGDVDEVPDGSPVGGGVINAQYLEEF